MKRKIIAGLAGLAIAALSVAACGSAHTASPAAAVSTSAPAASSSAPAPAVSSSAPAATSAPAAAASTSAPAMTTAQQQAVTSAQSYLSLGSGFSAQSLLNQLTSTDGSGFSNSDAEFAIRYLKPDWDAQAVMAAKGYLALGTGFSASSLTQQLTSSDGNGFTQAQAEYAVSKVGL